MQPDIVLMQFSLLLNVEGSVQFSLIPEVCDGGEQMVMSDNRWFLTVIKKFLIDVVTDCNMPV